MLGGNCPEIVEVLAGVLQGKSGVCNVGLGLGDLHRSVWVPGVFEGVLSGAHVDPGLGDSLLKVRDGLGVQDCEGITCGHLVAVRYVDFRDSALLSESECLASGVSESPGYADIVDEVAAGDGDELCLTLFLLLTRFGPDSVGVVAASGYRGQGDHTDP